MAKLKLNYWKSKEDGQWYWHIKARNGRIVCDSGAYNRRASLLKELTILFAVTMGHTVSTPNEIHP